jgi:hypothetical protein
MGKTGAKSFHSDDIRPIRYFSPRSLGTVVKSTPDTAAAEVYMYFTARKMEIVGFPIISQDEVITKRRIVGRRASKDMTPSPIAVLVVP